MSILDGGISEILGKKLKNWNGKVEYGEQFLAKVTKTHCFVACIQKIILKLFKIMLRFSN